MACSPAIQVRAGCGGCSAGVFSAFWLQDAVDKAKKLIDDAIEKVVDLAKSRVHTDQFKVFNYFGRYSELVALQLQELWLPYPMCSLRQRHQHQLIQTCSDS